MASSLTREQIVDLVYYCGATKVKNREGKDDIQLTCPVHGESNPSMGFSISKQICHCLSCHFAGDARWLVYNSLPDEFKGLDEVDQFLFDRYGLDLHKFEIDQLKNLKRYEDFEAEEPEKRHELPLPYIAPFKSGKETYQYFYDRGFTKATVKEFRIGRDLVNKTITVPIFWEDKKLAGVIGRYINPNRRKNERYKIYEGTPTGLILFPFDKGEPVDDTYIIVEGLLDAVWLHQLGFINAKALLTNKLSKEQADWLLDKGCKIIDMTDNDEMGDFATNSIKQRLKGLTIYTVKHAYPEGKKDAQELNREEIQYMLDNKISSVKSRLRRIE